MSEGAVGYGLNRVTLAVRMLQASLYFWRSRDESQSLQKDQALQYLGTYPGRINFE